MVKSNSGGSASRADPTSAAWARAEGQADNDERDAGSESMLLGDEERRRGVQGDDHRSGVAREAVDDVAGRPQRGCAATELPEEGSPEERDRAERGAAGTRTR